MAIKFTNNASSKLASALVVENTSTFSVTAGTGDKFPAVSSPDYFMATIVASTGAYEIVKVTQRTAGSDTLTADRGEEGTTKLTFPIGAVIECRPTAGSFQDVIDIVDSVDYLPTPVDTKFIGPYDAGSTSYPARTAAEMRTDLGLGTSATVNTVGDSGNIPLEVQTAVPSVDKTAVGSRFTAPLDSSSGLAWGSPVGLNSTGNGFALSNFNLVTTGLCLEDSPSGTVEILTHGFARNDAWSWTPGSPIYVNFNGTLTHTPTGPEPTAAVNAQRVAVAVTPDVIFFNPSLDELTVSNV